MKADRINQKILIECKRKLVLLREDILNRLRGAKLEVTAYEKMSGDEIDQTVAQSIENQFALNQKRLRSLLLEVDNALSRIHKGAFGFCEETHEPIEVERLLAIPYTRFSIEGAELREALQKRYAR